MRSELLLWCFGQRSTVRWLPAGTSSPTLPSRLPCRRSCRQPLHSAPLPKAPKKQFRLHGARSRPPPRPSSALGRDHTLIYPGGAAAEARDERPVLLQRSPRCLPTQLKKVPPTCRAPRQPPHTAPPSQHRPHEGLRHHAPLHEAPKKPLRLHEGRLHSVPLHLAPRNQLGLHEGLRHHDPLH